MARPSATAKATVSTKVLAFRCCAHAGSRGKQSLPTKMYIVCIILNRRQRKRLVYRKIKYLGDEDINTVARDAEGSQNAVSLVRRRIPADDVSCVHA